MRAVLYCRVSSLEQVQNLSLPTQEKACREYADRNGYGISAVFVDRGESAKTTARPEFQRMLAHCRQHKGHVHAVIVYGLSRFSRNNADHHAIAALLRGQGIALRSVTEPIDDSPAGRFMEAVIAGMAQFDNDMRADRTRVGLKAAAERGRWVWAPPLGYRPGAHRRGEPSLVPHAEYGPLIARAFTVLAGTDRSIAEVCRELQAAGMVARGGRPVSLETLHRMLRNPTYCGRLSSPALGLELSGDWTPLVSEATWDRVQLRLGRDGRANRRDAAHPDFSLRGFAHCAACGRGLTAGWSKGRSAKYAYYRCMRNCPGTTAPKQQLEAAFVTMLEQLRPSAEWLATVRKSILLAGRAERDDRLEQRTRLEAERTRLESQLRRLEDAYLFEGAIDQATYARRRDELRERRTLADLALNEAVVDVLDVEGALAQAEYAIEHAAALWRLAPSADARRRLQAAILPDGVIWNGSAVLNRGTNWCCYQLGAGDGTGGDVVDQIRATLNRLASWSRAWHHYQAA